MRTLTTTRGEDRVLIECVGMRLRAAFASYPGEITFCEPFRQHLEDRLLEQKVEHPHDHDVKVEYIADRDRPIIRIIIGGLETHTLGD
ncbi:hypothetical protein D9M68_19700 [compost metagenome]